MPLRRCRRGLLLGFEHSCYPIISTSRVFILLCTALLLPLGGVRGRVIRRRLQVRPLPKDHRGLLRLSTKHMKRRD
ncbi:unnamed protein product [Boreogadus saida]